MIKGIVISFILFLGENKHYKYKNEHEMMMIACFKVSLSGVYHLSSADANYKDYLLAMDIPQTAADIIATMSVCQVFSFRTFTFASYFTFTALFPNGTKFHIK